jgi:hypothetical protein
MEFVARFFDWALQAITGLLAIAAMTCVTSSVVLLFVGFYNGKDYNRLIATGWLLAFILLGMAVLVGSRL